MSWRPSPPDAGQDWLGRPLTRKTSGGHREHGFDRARAEERGPGCHEGRGTSEHWGTGGWAPRTSYGAAPERTAEESVPGGWEPRPVPRQRTSAEGAGQENAATFDRIETWRGGPRDYSSGHGAGGTGERPVAPPRRSSTDRAEPGGRAVARRSTVGRALAGVTAAAVTTVLAVLVAGQPADSRDQVAGDNPAGGDMSRGDGKASRSQGRPTPKAPGERGTGADSLHEQLSRRFPLAEDLGLSGRFDTVRGTDKAPGRGTVVRYRVDVEKGLPLDGELFAGLVHETLNDPRSWSHGGNRAFERVSSGRADFVVTLASPGTTNVWCAKSGLDTSVDHVSCDSASTERVMINAYRWAQGASTFGDDMLGYRQMLINHEVGHRLGHNHERCSEDGALAPVMMQQTKYLTTDGVTCRPNPWPFP